ncbi:hypothetical protein COU74_01560 [Candidatus Peregrinibacteria bacterium CG10_big_fil_rev_8_21_14_0_10_36_19]|nr:MAG: hypothetical protein COU74_01560 [Candidatus Peregrinibacteria bacterium CG10_big_fil_rev_8_21_14_0_10_36_19]
MSTARKILSNTIAQIIGKALVALLGLIVVKVSTQYLGRAGFGNYSFIYEFLAFFGIAADLGLFTIAVKEMSENEHQIEKIIGNILSLRTILVATTMIIAVITVFLIPKYQNTLIPVGVAIASITVFLTILNGTLTSVLQTKLKMEVSSFATVIGKIFSVSFMLYVIFFGFPNDKETGFYMLILAGVIGMTVNLLITHHYVKKIAPINYQFDISLWKSILKKSAPYGLALILNTIYFRIDSILIFNMRSEEELGIYSVAMKMLESFSILPLYFMNSVLPTLTKSINEGEGRHKKVISYAFDFLASISVPMVIGGTILAYPIIFIVSTPDFLSRISEGFYGSDIAFQILIFALFFQFLNVLFAFILIAIDKQSRLLYINLFGVIFNLASNFLIIPAYGFRGAAFTSVLSEMFIFIATFLVARSFLKFNISIKNLAKIIFSGSLMGFAIYYLQPLSYDFFQNWNVLILIPFGAAIYLGSLLATGTVSKEMLQLLKKK